MILAPCAKCGSPSIMRSMSVLVGFDPRVGQLRVLVCGDCSKFICKTEHISMGCKQPKPAASLPRVGTPELDLSKYAITRPTITREKFDALMDFIDGEDMEKSIEEVRRDLEEAGLTASVERLKKSVRKRLQKLRRS